VPLRLRARQLPTRLATGAYVLHAGMEKWHANPDQAERMHAMAAGAFPILGKLAPTTFLRLLAAAEITTGAALLTPVVPNAIAGAPLTAFSAALTAMYLRTPTLHKPHSIWPTPAGIGISKDVWMLGIGLSLLADRAADNGTTLTEERRNRRTGPAGRSPDTP
jgi:uncharacterized membrane protein YphA (DoxX/SURF4 family)